MRETRTVARSDNAQVRRYFDKLAPKYDRSMQRCERFFLGHGREWATARASGDVLELAVGTGLSLPLYPASARVVGVDLSEEMLGHRTHAHCRMQHRRPRACGAR